MNYRELKFSSIKITTNTDRVNEHYNITPKISEILANLYQDAVKGKKSTIKRLQRYVKRYSSIPHFKNYLEVAYSAAGREDKAKEVNEWTRREHPEYLHAKISYANSLLDEGKPERVPRVLGEQLDLKSLYPDRKEFHVDEVLKFFFTCMRYYLAVGDEENAEKYLKFMKDIDPDEQMTKAAQNKWLQYKMELAKDHWDEEQKRRRTVESQSYDKEVQTSEPPAFTHELIEELYRNDIYIEDEILRDLLSLSRHSLISDLERVIEDAICRFEYFREQHNEHEEWDYDGNSFLLHALLLLGELRAETVLPQILRLLRQGEELLEFWLSDLLTEELWQIVYKIGKNRLDDLSEFMKERYIYTYGRTAISSAVSQLALHEPDRRAEVVAWYRELFRYFNSHQQDDGLIDTDVISMMVWDCMDINASEVEEEIQILYDAGLVESNMVGDKREISSSLCNTDHQRHVREVMDIYEKYDTLRQLYNKPPKREADTATNGNNEPYKFRELIGGQQKSEQIYAKEEPGRNDPCPCRSGKKYKYCCIRS
ncbi:MAG: DUF1186 domain-containing protein [Balneolaceae bacterium]|nr:DUF1186 domain-containing protein [Balneolaceae bacterium]